MAASSAGLAHVAAVGESQEVAIREGRRTWSRVNQSRIAESWLEQLQMLVPAITAEQKIAAAEGSRYVASSLAEQGSWVAPAAFANTDQLAGWAPDGRTLQGLLYSPAVNALTLIGGGMAPGQALATAGQGLDLIMTSLMADTSRQSASIDIASRDGVGWIRMANPPSCPRCTILAGRFYRWNDGFLRHPGCDCVHRPAHASSLKAARDEGLVQDPYEYFKSLSPAEQDRIFTRSGAQAIRDGADMGRVVNARRGMTENGMFTTEGMGKRGFARKSLKPRQRRLTPEAIYKLNPNRADALAELERHGYILPGGQNPLGAIKGASYEGYGELGRGGTRVGASRAVEQARASGVRDGSRYTMTAAERRVADAQLQWQAVLEGRNPLGKGPLTPRIAAAVETNVKRQLANAGQVFTASETATQQAERIVVRAGGGGGGNIKPPVTLTPGAGDEPNWAARQAALGINTHGEVLHPHEIEFMERFLAAGHQAEWIRSGKFLPTNDFAWLNHEGRPEFELKTTAARFNAIKGRIVDAASRAAKHQVVKDRFVIDIQDAELNDELRGQLARFNEGRRKYRLRELWVMARGQLHRINLTA